MASYTCTSRIHKTLTSTTVDTVTIPTAASWVEILNRSGAASLYVTDDGTDPVADADGTELIQVGESLTLEDPNSRTIKILGNGNIYDIATGS